MSIELTYSLLIGCVIVSGGAVFFIHDRIKKSIKYLLAFSGAFLMAICFLHLIPEIYNGPGVQIGLFVLLGFLIQLFLEFMSQGIEHGHVHIHHKHSFPIVVFISLCIHALLEGMPIDSAMHTHGHGLPGHDGGNQSLLAGIVLHKIPISVALTTMALEYGSSKTKAIVYLIIFALMAPVGIWVSHYFGSMLIPHFPGFFNVILAIVVGMLLHISTTILFETSEGHKFNFMKLFSILTGGLAAWLTLAA